MTSYAHVYLSHSGQGVVLAATAVNGAGIRYEPDYAILLPPSSTPAMLGQTIIDVLGQFCRKDRNLRNYKKSDWPAFRASGLKTIRAFEQDYSFVVVEHDERRLTLTRFEQNHAAADTVHLAATCSAETVGSGLMQLAERAGFKTSVKPGALPNGCSAAPVGGSKASPEPPPLRSTMNARISKSFLIVFAALLVLSGFLTAAAGGAVAWYAIMAVCALVPFIVGSRLQRGLGAAALALSIVLMVTDYKAGKERRAQWRAITQKQSTNQPPSVLTNGSSQ